jgi:hypothetical protein
LLVAGRKRGQVPPDRVIAGQPSWSTREGAEIFTARRGV